MNRSAAPRRPVTTAVLAAAVVTALGLVAPPASAAPGARPASTASAQVAPAQPAPAQPAPAQPVPAQPVPAQAAAAAPADAAPAAPATRAAAAAANVAADAAPNLTTTRRPAPRTRDHGDAVRDHGDAVRDHGGDVRDLRGAPATSGAPTRPDHRPAPGDRPVDPIAHDPTMVKERGWYYVAITGDAVPDDTYLPMKRSRDLVHWEELGPVFTELQPWVLEALGVTAEDAPRDAWAPDLFWTGTEWRLYYSVSQFGTNNSVIGLMTSPSLADPAWEDQGLVIRSTPGTDDFNAIDPNVVVDADGDLWLTFGSFFSGTQLVRLDPATGGVADGAEPVRIAQRETEPYAAENPAIVHRRGFYYLFLSYDFCCRGVESDYRTVVGRSTSITGPYVDAEGLPLLDGKGGTEVMRGYNEFVGAGGADVMLTGHGTGHGTGTGTGTGTGHGRGWVVNHYYDATDDGAPRLNVRRLTWTRDGWPRVSEPLNPSRTVGHGEAYVTIRPQGADTVVENAGCGYEGADVALWDDLGNLCQQWQVEDRGDGSRILNRFSNKVAEIAACDDVDGGDVVQWGCVGFLENNDCQRWRFAPAGDGWTTVASVLPAGRAWTVQGPPVAGADVVVSSPTGGAEQAFRFQPVGRVLLASPTDGTETLVVRGCRTYRPASGAVRFEDRSHLRCQTWRFRPVEGTAAYRVVNAASGRFLSTACGRGRDDDALRTVSPRRAVPGCTTWTLVPTDDGTWTLASGATEQEVRLLLP